MSMEGAALRPPMQSESVAKLAQALAKAQAKLTAPKRNREVTVTPRREGAKPYKFEYSTLDSLIEHVRGPLTENGLWFVQTTEPGGYLSGGAGFLLKTTLLHESGEYISGYLQVRDGGSNQEMGSELTYRKRYALSAILGLASDLDDDGNSADGNEISEAKERVMPSPRPAPLTKDDAAKAAAIKFDMNACEKLEKFSSREKLEEWRTKDTVAKIEKLKDYDLELYQMVIRSLHEATARLS